MNTQNINLSEEHFKEALKAVENNQSAIEKTGDTILDDGHYWIEIRGRVNVREVACA